MCYLLKVLYQKQNQCQQFLDNFIKNNPRYLSEV